MRGRWVSVLVLALFSFGARAEVSLTQLGFPPPERLLSTVAQGEFETESRQVFAIYKQLCHTKGARNAEARGVRTENSIFCELPEKVRRFEKIAASVFRPDGDIVVRTEAQRRTPWDLRELVAGNFMELPSRDGEAAGDSVSGLKAVVALFVLRSEIVRDLDELWRLGAKPGAVRDYRQIVFLPALQAHIKSSSALGGMMAFFEAIRCETEDRLCNRLKDGFGGAIAAALPTYAEKVKSFGRRLEAASDEFADEPQRRLRNILEFARTMNQAERFGAAGLSAAEIEVQINRLVGEGQGALSDEAYQNLAIAIVSLAEALNVVDRSENFSPYREVLTAKEQKQAIKKLNPALKASVEALERAIQIFGMKEDIEGKI